MSASSQHAGGVNGLRADGSVAFYSETIAVSYTHLDVYKRQDMEQAGLVIKVEPYLMKVPRTQRGGEIVEPMV